MERKEQEQFALLLMKRMQELINKNIVERNRYKTIEFKRRNDTAYQMTEEEKNTYWNGGVAVKKSAFKRVRIELNEVLKELEKNNGNN